MRFPFIDHERYQLVRELGESSQGVSFLVRDRKRHDEEIVIVLIERDLPQKLDGFRRAIESLARLKHANLVPYFEPVLEAGHVGYSRAFIEGSDLRQVATSQAAPGQRAEELEAGAPPPSFQADLSVTPVREVMHTPLDLNSLEIARQLETLSEDTDEVGEIISQVSRPNQEVAPPKSLGERLTLLGTHLPEVLAALEHLHRFKRTHGALHPGCIILDEATRTWKLADFGIPNLLEPPSDESSPPLSSDATRMRWRQRRVWAYRAPELFLGQPPTPASDIYALGCIIYEVIAQRPPFQGVDEDLGKRHLVESPMSLLERQPRTPSSWARLVDEMLQKDATLRPTLAQIEHELTQCKMSPTLIPPSFIPAPGPLYGRTQVLQRVLERAVESERARSLSTLMLTGDEGVGKHHMFEHVCATLSRRGWLILRGRCYPEHVEPYQGWREIIAQLLDLLNHCPSSVALELSEPQQLAAAIFPELDISDQPRTGIEPMQRLEATGALRELIGALSEHRPVLLGFNALHQAGRDSLELLHDFRAGRKPFRGMVLATSQMSAQELFPEHDREQAPTITIPAMDQDAAQHYITSITQPPPESLTAFISKHPLHNPLLLKELIYEYQRREHLDEAAVIEEILPERLGPGGAIDAIKRLLGTRIARVSGEALGILRTLAIKGSPTTLDQLASVDEAMGQKTPASELSASETALTRLCAMRLAKRLPSRRGVLPSYRIGNRLIREQVLKGISPGEHDAIREAIARSITANSAHAHAHRFEYFSQANLPELALEHIDPALDDAVARLAFGRASDLQRWRLKQAESGNERAGERDALARTLARFEAATGRHTVAAQLYHDIAQRLPTDPARVHILCDEAGAWFYAGNLKEAELALTEALLYFGERYELGRSADLLGEMRERWGRLWMGRMPADATLTDLELVGEEASKIRLYTLLLDVSLLLNSARAPLHQRRLEALGRKSLDRRTCADALLHRAQTMLMLDGAAALRDAPELLDEATRHYELLGEHERLTRVHVTRARLEMLMGHVQEASARFERADERWRVSTTHTRAARASLDMHRGMAACALGRLARARHCMESLFHEERHLEPARLGGHLLAVELDLLTGHPTRAEQHLDRIDQQLSGLTPSWLEVWKLHAMARQHLAMGRPEVAIGQLDVHLERMRETGILRYPSIEVMVLQALAWALTAQLQRQWALNDSRRQEMKSRLAATLRRLSRLVTHRQAFERCALERLRARQEWLAGRPRKALRILDEAVLEPEHIPGALEQAKFAEARGLLLIELEREGAQDLYLQAHQMYDALGICSPLILEGWPVHKRYCSLSHDEPS